MWNIYKFHPKKWTQNDQKFDEHKPKRERRRRIRKKQQSMKRSCGNQRNYDIRFADRSNN